MKVAIYCDCNSRAGVWAYTLSLTEHLRRLGARVHILSHAPNSPAQRPISETLLASADSSALVPNGEPDSADILNLARALVESKSDAYIPNYRQNPHAALIRAHRVSTIPGVSICHNHDESSYGLLGRYVRALSKVVCASPVTAEEFTRRHPDRAQDIRFIPHGVRLPERTRAPFEGGVLKLIYHGRLCEEQKQISLLLEVADGLVRAGVPFTLRLIGDGSGVPEYTRRIESGPLKHNVSIQPSMEWPDLVSALLDSHVAVLTSAYEGFCFGMAEAMGCGLPGVAFHTGGIVEGYLHDGQNGFVLAPRDVAGMVNALSRLQHDPELWRKMSAAAREVISTRYSWERSSQQYLNLLEETVRTPRTSSWPPLRPSWIPEGRRTWRSVVDRVGTLAHLWS